MMIPIIKSTWSITSVSCERRQVFLLISINFIPVIIASVSTGFNPRRLMTVGLLKYTRQ